MPHLTKADFDRLAFSLLIDVEPPDPGVPCQIALVIYDPQDPPEDPEAPDTVLDVRETIMNEADVWLKDQDGLEDAITDIGRIRDSLRDLADELTKRMDAARARLT